MYGSAITIRGGFGAIVEKNLGNGLCTQVGDAGEVTNGLVYPCPLTTCPEGFRLVNAGTRSERCVAIEAPASGSSTPRVVSTERQSGVSVGALVGAVAATAIVVALLASMRKG